MNKVKTIEGLDPNFRTPDDAGAAGGFQWCSAETLTVEGVGWPEESELFCRFPNRSEAVLRDAIWRLSRCSSGVCIRFLSDTSTLAVRWGLRFDELARAHMPATSTSGLDLYVRDPESGRIRWASLVKPQEAATNFAQLLADQPGEMREYFLYLPLLNSVSFLEIGVEPDARLLPARLREEKPICFYGASIVQGACAARAGMAFPAQLGRRLEHAHWNFGFSGNSHAEPEVAELLAELDPSLYVIGPAPSLKEGFVRQQLEPFLETLRTARPEVPILIVENAVYADQWISPKRFEPTERANEALRQVFDKVKAQIGNLHFVEGSELLGADNEATVDGTHPTDAGFIRIADALFPQLKALIEGSE